MQERISNQAFYIVMGIMITLITASIIIPAPEKKPIRVGPEPVLFEHLLSHKDSKYELNIYPDVDGCKTIKKIYYIEVYKDDSLILKFDTVNEMNLRCQDGVFTTYHAIKN